MGVHGSEANETADVKGIVLVCVSVCVCVADGLKIVSKCVCRPVQIHYCTSFCESLRVCGYSAIQSSRRIISKQHFICLFLSAICPTVWSMEIFIPKRQSDKEY